MQITQINFKIFVIATFEPEFNLSHDRPPSTKNSLRVIYEPSFTFLVFIYPFILFKSDFIRSNFDYLRNALQNVISQILLKKGLLF